MLQGKRILVVDDQPEIGAQIAAYLRSLKFLPVVVTSVDEALLNFSPDKFMLIICDIMMPGRNGIDLLRHIRTEHPKFPVALISGYYDKEMENIQKVFGIPKIYRKPLFLSTIKEIIIDSLQLVPNSKE